MGQRSEMDGARFWTLIDDARHEPGKPDELAARLIDKLAAMDIESVLCWAQIYDAYQQLSYKMKLWAAAYVINGGCSDDGFEYFRGWLISQGQHIFLRALADPDSLAEVDVRRNEAEYEDMLGVGSAAYFKKVGMAKGDYTAYTEACAKHPLGNNEQRALAASIHFAQDIDRKWSEGDLKKVVPRLYAKFG